MLKCGELTSSKNPRIPSRLKRILSSTSIFLLKRNDPNEFKEEGIYEKIT